MYRFVTLAVFLLLIPLASFADLHDPTRPPGAPISTGILGSNIAIKAIILGHNKKEVLIGGRYFTIGDKIGGSKIIDIFSSAIVLQNRGGAVTIPMFIPINKRHNTNPGDKP